MYNISVFVSYPVHGFSQKHKLKTPDTIWLWPPSLECSLVTTKSRGKLKAFKKAKPKSIQQKLEVWKQTLGLIFQLLINFDDSFAKSHQQYAKFLKLGTSSIRLGTK